MTLKSKHFSATVNENTFIVCMHESRRKLLKNEMKAWIRFSTWLFLPEAFESQRGSSLGSLETLGDAHPTTIEKKGSKTLNDSGRIMYLRVWFPTAALLYTTVLWSILLISLKIIFIYHKYYLRSSTRKQFIATDRTIQRVSTRWRTAQLTCLKLVAVHTTD